MLTPVLTTARTGPMLRLGNLYVKSYGDNEHGEANKCLIDLFQVEIVVDVGLTLVTYG